MSEYGGTRGDDMRQKLLEIRGLEVEFQTRRGIARAVNCVDLTLYAGERFGLVGESGSGKTTMILALLRMIREPGRISGGQVLLDGIDLLKLSDEEMRKTRLAGLAMVPQGAMNSLNPVMRVGDQIRLTMSDHGQRPGPAEAGRIEELLQMVGLRPQIAELYPHELSGGMKQRACIAIAISLRPRLILADEPTSALDVVVQRHIMQTLRSLGESMDATVLLVGHDMGLMAQMVDRIAVMYAGNIVEISPTNQLFKNPSHPYSKILIESIPSIKDKNPLKLVEGITHDPRRPPPGCIFQLRCPLVEPRCKENPPSMKKISNGREVSCHFVS